jgi:hypothetical protein
MELRDSPWKLFEMLGKAMFTMNRSNDERNTPVSTTRAVSVGRDPVSLAALPGRVVSCVMRLTVIE